MPADYRAQPRLLVIGVTFFLYILDAGCEGRVKFCFGFRVGFPP